MIARLLAGGLLCWSLALSAAAQGPPKKHALLIGVDKYLRSLSVPPLQYAQNDVKDLKAALEKRGYEVTTLVNSDASRNRALSELYRLADVVQEGDDFLLYYAGHGVRNRFPSRKTFWLTYDADLELLDATGIRLQHLLDYVLDIKAGRKLILLDHCFSGDVVVGPAPAVQPGAPPSPAPPGPASPGVVRAATGTVGLQRGAFPVGEIRDQVRKQAEGLMIITAARGGAFELDALRHGVFTAALLKALETTAADINRDGRLSAAELANFVDQEADKLVGTANVQQDVDVYHNVTNPQAWFVVENLSDPEAQADLTVRKATKKLGDWAQLGWIDDDPTKQSCWQALLDWLEAVRAQRKLADDQQRLVDRTLRAMEGSPAFERARADELNQFVKGLSTP